MENVEMKRRSNTKRAIDELHEKIMKEIEEELTKIDDIQKQIEQIRKKNKLPDLSHLTWKQLHELEISNEQKPIAQLQEDNMFEQIERENVQFKSRIEDYIINKQGGENLIKTMQSSNNPIKHVSKSVLDNLIHLINIRSFGAEIIKTSIFDWDKSKQKLISLYKENGFSDKNALLNTQQIITDFQQLKKRIPEELYFYIKVPSLDWDEIAFRNAINDVLSNNFDSKFWDFITDIDLKDSNIDVIFNPNNEDISGLEDSNQIREMLPVFTILRRLFFYKCMLKARFKDLIEQNSFTNDEINRNQAADDALRFIKLMMITVDPSLYDSMDDDHSFFQKNTHKIKNPNSDSEKEFPFDVQSFNVHNIKDFFTQKAIFFKKISGEFIKPEIQSLGGVKHKSGFDYIQGRGVIGECKHRLVGSSKSALSQALSFARISLSEFKKNSLVKKAMEKFFDKFIIYYEDSGEKKPVKFSEIMKDIVHHKSKRYGFKTKDILSSNGIFSRVIQATLNTCSGRGVLIDTHFLVGLMVGIPLSSFASTGYSVRYGFVEYGRIIENKWHQTFIIEADESSELYFKIPKKDGGVLQVVPGPVIGLTDYDVNKLKQDHIVIKEPQVFFAPSSTGERFGLVIVVTENEVFAYTYDEFNSRYALATNEPVKIEAIDYIQTKFQRVLIDIDTKEAIVDNKQISLKLHNEDDISAIDRHRISIDGIGKETFTKFRIVNVNSKNKLVLALHDKNGNIWSGTDKKTVYWDILENLFSKIQDKNAFDSALQFLTPEKYASMDMITALNTIVDDLKKQGLKVSHKEMRQYLNCNALHFNRFLRTREVKLPLLNRNKFTGNYKSEIKSDLNFAFDEYTRYLSLLRVNDRIITVDELVKDQQRVAIIKNLITEFARNSDVLASKYEEKLLQNGEYELTNKLLKLCEYKLINILKHLETLKNMPMLFTLQDGKLMTIKNIVTFVQSVSPRWALGLINKKMEKLFQSTTIVSPNNFLTEALKRKSIPANKIHEFFKYFERNELLFETDIIERLEVCKDYTYGTLLDKKKGLNFRISSFSKMIDYFTALNRKIKEQMRHIIFGDFDESTFVKETLKEITKKVFTVTYKGGRHKQSQTVNWWDENNTISIGRLSATPLKTTAFNNAMNHELKKELEKKFGRKVFLYPYKNGQLILFLTNLNTLYSANKNNDFLYIFPSLQRNDKDVIVIELPNGEYAKSNSNYFQKMQCDIEELKEFITNEYGKTYTFDKFFKRVAGILDALKNLKTLPNHHNDSSYILRIFNDKENSDLWKKFGKTNDEKAFILHFLNILFSYRNNNEVRSILNSTSKMFTAYAIVPYGHKTDATHVELIKVSPTSLNIFMNRKMKPNITLENHQIEIISPFAWCSKELSFTLIFNHLLHLHQSFRLRKGFVDAGNVSKYGFSTTKIPVANSYAVETTFKTKGIYWCCTIWRAFKWEEIKENDT